LTEKKRGNSFGSSSFRKTDSSLGKEENQNKGGRSCFTKIVSSTGIKGGKRILGRGEPYPDGGTQLRAPPETLPVPRPKRQKRRTFQPLQNGKREKRRNPTKSHEIERGRLLPT